MNHLILTHRFYQKIRVVTASLLLLFAVPTLAQLNIKAGYNAVGLSPSYTNKAIDAFNENNKTALIKALPRLVYMHSLEMGLRYQIENLALEATYYLKFNPLRANLQPAGQTAKTTQILNCSNNSFSVGAEIITLGWLGFGATLDWTTTLIRTRRTGDANSTTVANQSGLSNHFYLNCYLGGTEMIGASLRPFVQIPWTRVDMSALGNALAPNNTGLGSPHDNFFNFGIGLIFFNGKQPSADQ